MSKPRRDQAFKEACADIVQLAQILGNRCEASGIDVSEIPITCKSVPAESHYVLTDKGIYVRRYGGKKKRNG